MGSWRSGVPVVVIAMLIAAVGVATADEAYIKSVDVVDTIDRDGDGAVSGFNVRITADTNCVGCNDESDDSPNIEPTFYVDLVDEDGDTVELGRSEEVDNEDDLVFVYEIPDDIIEQYQAQTLEVVVTLFDEDTFSGETMDVETIRVDVERPEDDQTPTPTATPSPTPTPSPTATPTPTDSPTPTDTSVETEDDEFASGGNGDDPASDGASQESDGSNQESDGSGIRDSDGDGVIDSQDYAPNDPDVSEKSDVSSLSVPGFTTNTVVGVLGVLGAFVVVYRRWG